MDIERRVWNIVCGIYNQDSKTPFLKYFPNYGIFNKMCSAITIIVCQSVVIMNTLPIIWANKATLSKCVGIPKTLFLSTLRVIVKS